MVKIIGIVLFLCGVWLLCWSTSNVIHAAAAPETPTFTTQNYQPAAFALFAAEINVSSLDLGNTRPQQKVLARLNTATGEVAILQLMITGPGRGQIASAGWYPVAESVEPSPDADDGADL